MKAYGWTCDICGRVKVKHDAFLVEKPGSFSARVYDVTEHQWSFPEICDVCSSSLVGALDAIVNSLKEQANGIQRV